MITADDSDFSWVRSKFLAGLSDEALRQLLDKAHLRHIAAKEDVIVSGGQADHLFLLKAGQARSYIRTEDGRESVLLWAAPGSFWIGIVIAWPQTIWRNHGAPRQHPDKERGVEARRPVDPARHLGRQSRKLRIRD